MKRTSPKLNRTRDSLEWVDRHWHLWICDEWIRRNVPGIKYGDSIHIVATDFPPADQDDVFYLCRSSECLHWWWEDEHGYGVYSAMHYELREFLLQFGTNELWVWGEIECAEEDVES